SGGTDLISVGFSLDIGVNDGIPLTFDDSFPNIENLTLTGSTDLDGVGNALKNVVTGNGGRNALSGQDGDDQLLGKNGADTLNGGNGMDTLQGDAGNDHLTGSANADIFVFVKATDIGGGDSGLPRDIVADFNTAEDRLYLKG